MKHNARKAVALCLLICLGIQLSGCGTIIYPERRGQASGKLDPAIIAANGVGLLFFFVPGVVAFAVDFSTGAIYQSSASKGNGQASLESLQLEGKPDLATIEQALERSLNREVDLAASEVHDLTGISQEQLAVTLRSYATL